MGEVEIEMSSKGQVVIPVKMRKRFGLSKGDRFVAWDKDDIIILKPIVKLSSLMGKYKTKGGGTRELMRMREEDLKLEKEHKWGR